MPGLSPPTGAPDMSSSALPSAVAFDAAAKVRLLRRAAATTPLWVGAKGSSMGWTIRSGSEVHVRTSASPRRGQVWAYCDDTGRLVVHRYRRRTEGGHVLQGDTCVRPDSPVDDARLVGKVVAVRRGGRTRSIGRTDVIFGASQRIPRVLVARTVRAARNLRRRDG